MNTIIVTASVTAIVSTIAGYLFKQLLNTFASAQEQWHRERRELLERIQRPERIPQEPEMQSSADWFDPDPDDSAQVGQIHWDDAYLNDEAVSERG